MILRIEFTANKSPNFKRALGICRKLKSFKEKEEDGIKLYSVEFNEREFFTAEAIRDFVMNWQGTAYYIDDQLISSARAYRLIFDEAKETQNSVRRAHDVPSDPIDPEVDPEPKREPVTDFFKRKKQFASFIEQAEIVKELPKT